MSSDVADQVANLPPIKQQFEIPTDRFLLWEPRQIKWHIRRQIYLPIKQQFEIPTDRFLFWELRCGRPGGRSNPPIKQPFEIPTDSFLLWVFRQIKWQTKRQIYIPNTNLQFILVDSYSESSDESSGRSSGRYTPHQNSDLNFLLIDSFSESSGRWSGRPGCRSPPTKCQFENHTCRFLLWELRCGRPGGRSTPLNMGILNSYW